MKPNLIFSREYTVNNAAHLLFERACSRPTSATDGGRPANDTL